MNLQLIVAYLFNSRPSSQEPATGSYP
jgi:hypothetical protein